MELRHLRYFIAVAEELHFGNAAKRLNISQPPLSQQIKQLEKHLNVSLFQRTNRNVELTEAGQSFYQHATKILHDVTIAREDTRSTAEGFIGELKLGFSGTAAFHILPEITKANRKYNPGISLQLRQLSSAEQINALEKRTIDMGLLVPPVENPLIVTERIRTEDYVICLPENHRLAHEDKINVKDLKNESFILSSRQAGVGYYDSIQLIFKEAGFSPKISQTANDQLTMVSLVSSGLGIVIVPKSTEAIKIAGVVYKELHKSYTRLNAIAWNKENIRPVVTNFLKLIREQIIPKYQS